VLTSVVIALAAFISAAQTPQCQPGEVLGVEHGRDYVLNICDAGRVALRGVEPPLRTATVIGFRNEGGVTLTGGELLGDRDVGPEAIAFLSAAVGQRVTLVYDGFRIGDLEGRRYAYVFLRDKTFVNAQMIQRGLGYADRRGSHPRRDEFIALEAAARRSKVGVWAS
jgi:endonuclease YncB( thermonuclease family)